MPRYVCEETVYIELRQKDIWSSSSSDSVLNVKIEIEAFVANRSYRTHRNIRWVCCQDGTDNKIQTSASCTQTETSSVFEVTVQRYVCSL